MYIISIFKYKYKWLGSLSESYQTKMKSGPCLQGQDSVTSTLVQRPWHPGVITFLNLVALLSTPWPEHRSPRWGRLALLSQETHTWFPERRRRGWRVLMTSLKTPSVLFLLASLHCLVYPEDNTVPGCWSCGWRGWQFTCQCSSPLAPSLSSSLSPRISPL